MANENAPNPYRAPRARSASLDQGPSALRLVTLRLAAVGLGAFAVLSGIILLLYVIKRGVAALRLATLASLATIVIALYSARLLWQRAALSPDEARQLDALADFEELRGLYERNELIQAARGEPGDYAMKTSRELVQIYDRIDPQRAGPRYRQLVSAIRLRVEHDNEDDAAS